MRDHLSDNEQTMREFNRVLGTSLGTNVTRNAPPVEGREPTADGSSSQRSEISTPYESNSQAFPKTFPKVTE